MYVLNCADPATMCATSAARADAWTALPSEPSGRTFIGKPSADYQPDGWLMVEAVADDRAARLIGGYLGSFRYDSGWIPQAIDLDPADPEPGVAIQLVGANRSLFARNQRHALVTTDGNEIVYPPMGGVLASVPAQVIAPHGVSRMDVAALIADHGHPGVWWKFFSFDGYTAPCNYNAPGTCAQCGCNVPNSPACFE
jgi:hypothetical protein